MGLNLPNQLVGTDRFRKQRETINTLITELGKVGANSVLSGSAPTVNEDDSSGYLVGDLWLHNNADTGFIDTYVLTDSTDTAANWELLSRSGNLFNTAPTVTNDNTEGWRVGDLYIHQDGTDYSVYIAISVGTGTATWAEISSTTISETISLKRSTEVFYPGDWVHLNDSTPSKQVSHEVFNGYSGSSVTGGQILHFGEEYEIVDGTNAPDITIYYSMTTAETGKQKNFVVSVINMANDTQIESDFTQEINTPTNTARTSVKFSDVITAAHLGKKVRFQIEVNETVSGTAHNGAVHISKIEISYA